jgi:hypothetical protein
MTLPYQLHNKLRQQRQKQTSLSSNSFDFKILQKPFWIWNQIEHRTLAKETDGQCCWNQVVGLPIKNNKEYPLFDYEKTLFNSLLFAELNNPLNLKFKHKHLWVKKATGLGITEFMLRLMAWLCTSTEDNRFRNSQMCIVTGPNIEMATKLIKRMKGIFERKLGLYFTNKETVLELNGVTVEAFPSNHIDSFRALDNPKFILLDEADFFRKSEQDDVRHVSERYIGKSDPYIVMVSTPNNPGGLFERIEKESEDQCLYKRLKLDYTYGLGKGKIYSQEEIETAKQSPGFEREYNLKYLGKIGNVFSQLQIDRVILLGEKFKDLPVNQYCLHTLGIDPGFGSSKTALVLTEHLKEPTDNIIRIIYAEEFERPNPQEIADLCFDFHRKYMNTWFIVDGSNRGFITELKIKFGEDADYEKDGIDPENMKVIPINFSTEHKNMLSHLHLMVNKEHLAIPKKFDKLIVSLGTAYAKEYSLDKEQTSYDDLLDGLRLSLKGFNII